MRGRIETHASSEAFGISYTMFRYSSRIMQRVACLFRQGSMKFRALWVIADEVGSVNLGGLKTPMGSSKP